MRLLAEKREATHEALLGDVGCEIKEPDALAKRLTRPWRTV